MDPNPRQEQGDGELHDLRTFTSIEAIEYVKRLTDTVILSFSGGKDSLAAWLRIREHFDTIVPVYHYLVPGLRFVDEYLWYVEDMLDTHIVQLPHPVLTGWLWGAAYQPPLEMVMLHDYGFRQASYDDYIEDIRKALRAPEAWVAVGTTQNDSANRRLTFKKFGMTRDRAKKFFPIGDFKKQDIIDIITGAGMKLPADYRIWGRSWDGFDASFLPGLMRHYPDDYARIVEAFPMAALEEERMKLRKVHPHA